MKKIMTLLATMATLVALSSPQILAEDKKTPPLPKKTIEQTEKDLMTACLEDKKNNPAECKCVLNGFKEELKGDDYQFLMGLLTEAIRDNGDKVADMVMEKSILDLLLLTKRLEKAANTVEKQCDGVNINLNLQKA